LTVDVDATLIVAHFDGKDRVGKTYQRTWASILSTPTSTAVTVTRVAVRAATAGPRGLAHQRTRTGRDWCRIATGIPPITSRALALGGIGVASRPGSRPSPAAPRYDQPVEHRR